MKKYRILTLTIVGLCLSVSFLVSPASAAENHGIMMLEGKLMMMHDEREVSRMDRAMTLSGGPNNNAGRKDNGRSQGHAEGSDGQVAFHGPHAY